MIDRFEGEYAFLSNFYPAPMHDKFGIHYPTVEHCFQACKTLDLECRKRIANAERPGIAKKMGNSLELRHDWEKVRFKVMEACLRIKFKHPHLRELLNATEDEYLVEGNYWHDNLWGNCYCPKCHGKPGYNHLGKLLMAVRDDKSTKV